MARRKKTSANQRHGLLVLNKPSGPTSAGCLDQIKRTLDQPKIGHAGTLDPLANGVLLVLLGQGTKIAQYLAEGGKTYVGQLKLGVTTDTYDVEGAVVSEAPWERITPEMAQEAVAGWLDMTEQIAPPYSAAKHKGQPLYKLAREGKETPIKRRPLEISHAQVLEMDLPWIRFRVSCGSGTYVRSLAHSLGIRLECGAMLTELTRECSHPFCLDQAHDLDDVLNEPDALSERIIPLAGALPHWPRVHLTQAEAALVRNGARLPFCQGMGGFDEPFELGRKAMLVLGERGDEDGQGTNVSACAPIALVEARQEDGVPSWVILRGL